MGLSGSQATKQPTFNDPVPQLWSRDARELSSGLVQEQRQERSLWSLEAQVCWCHLKKAAFSPHYPSSTLFSGISKQLVFICVSFSKAMMQCHDNAYPQKTHCTELLRFTPVPFVYSALQFNNTALKVLNTHTQFILVSLCPHSSKL